MHLIFIFDKMFTNAGGSTVNSNNDKVFCLCKGIVISIWKIIKKYVI